MTKYITYLRVSTKHQGGNGLGIEAQRSAVASFARDGEIIAEYVEVESGKKTNRPQLNAALAHARREKATLLIAKLDRLARNVHFVSGLVEAKIDFIAADMPHANKMTIQLMAVMAEYERDQASARTKAALAVAKGRGIKLGGPDPRGAAAKWSAQQYERGAEARGLAQTWRDEGLTLQNIAIRLQRANIKTARDNANWSPKQVSRLLDH